LFETAFVYRDFDADTLKHVLGMLDGAVKLVTLGDIRLYECPNSYVTEETGDILQAVFLVTETHIPYVPGGWQDQPHWLSEAVALYKKESLEWMEKQREKPDKTKSRH
jgi:hypothetical protein